MIDTTLCYIVKGEQVLMLHRVKKKNDLNHDKWIGVGGKFLPMYFMVEDSWASFAASFGEEYADRVMAVMPPPTTTSAW